MPSPETDIGGPARGFPNTSWTMIRQVRERDPEKFRDALERLLVDYWKPVYWVILRGWQKSREDAKDLTQEFFSTIVLDKGLIDRFAPDRGSFRGFLKGAVTNFMRDARKAERREKRGGGKALLSIDFGSFNAAEQVADPRTLAADDLFDLAWKREVLSKAAALLERRLLGRGKPACFEVFRLYDLRPEGPQGSYQQIADSLDLSLDTVKNYLTLAREEFRAAVNQVLSDTVTDSAALSDEVDAFLS